MSREIVEKLVNSLCADSFWVQRGIHEKEALEAIRQTAERVATFIERLLADERAHGRQEANGDWLSCLIGRAGDTSYGELAGPILNVSDTLTRFIEAEREKVREMCIEAAELVSGQAHDECLRAVLNTRIDRLDGETRGAQRVANAIRQLDLTKDLAASSTEEGGDAHATRNRLRMRPMP